MPARNPLSRRAKTPNYNPAVPFSLMRLIILPSLTQNYVRLLRVLAWNAAFIISGMLLFALCGEMYLRLANPFIKTSFLSQFVDGVGLIRKPNSEVRFAEWNDDNFVVSRTNSHGFLDREPVSPENAAVGCHIAFIGDSFVEAREVSIADKFHVRLEEMAARELPHLDITTQAYGIRGTGQINQLPFYDEYARHQNPKLVALVFFINDFLDNSPALQSLAFGLDPDRMPYLSAQRDARGDIKLRPPDPEFRQFRLPRPQKRWYERAWERLIEVSYLAKWLDTKGIRVDGSVDRLSREIDAPTDSNPLLAAWANIVAERPCCTLLLSGWQPGDLRSPLMMERLPPVFEEALEYTAFGIDQFKRRADRDGATLAILTATENMGRQGDIQFDRLSAIAEARRIPVISQYDYIVNQEYDYKDGRWRFNSHWNETGHQWAAEAVLEWLKENQEVCD